MATMPIPDRRRMAMVVGLVLVGVAALVALAWQVEVRDEVVGVRGCGSGFDVLADRSGWEVWWARDLDEPDPAAREVLLRTTECPAAVNRRLAVAGSLAVIGAVVAAVAFGRRRPEATAVGLRQRLERLGRITRFGGLALAVGGAAALLLVVADADSTLFLYVDRSVVVLVGLVALVPTLALAAIGHALTLMAAAMTEGAEADESLVEDRTVEP